MAMELTEQAKNLSISERIRLVEEIWDTIAEENEAFELTDAPTPRLGLGVYAMHRRCFDPSSP